MKRFFLLACLSLVLIGGGCRTDETKDIPVIPDDQVHVDPQDEVAIEATLQVQNQPLGRQVTIAQVESNADGWVVLYEKNGDRPGKPVGHARISEGQQTNVLVDITLTEPQMLYALVHEDSGTPGTFEFPEHDLPPAKATAVSFELTPPAAAQPAAALPVHNAPEDTPTPGTPEKEPGDAVADIDPTLPDVTLDLPVVDLPSPGELIGCTEEARQCPDGSWVGRTGPNCAFTPCP